MSILRLRLTGDEGNVEAVVNALHGVEGIERLEQVDDLIPRMRDDSSSAGLPDDGGSSLHCIEIEVAGEAARERVRRTAETGARQYGLALEFVERF